ncbi:MAG: hypothetical protein EPN88_12590 [Bacteroidetes bacterium]|nr:MAG: hypothetical protein EPN88_12590 [Bacteroidota bacterium]
MLKIKTLLLFLITFQSVFSQKNIISGYVEDINTGERVIGAYVIDTISKSVAQTNNFGFYNLKKIGSKAAILATFIGLKSEVICFSMEHDTLLNIQMQPVRELKEVVVASSPYKHNVNAPLGLTTIPVTQLTSVPALGESDLLKSIQSQPGIKGGVEGSAGIFVRGGSGGENLFMLDDVPMYNVSHLYGFFSAFNNSAVKDIKLLKGCFPAQYGGRVSSVIDVRSRDGNNKSVKGEISLGIISSKLTLEGPLLSDKTTFTVSGRRSYFDLYSGALKNLDLLDKDFPGYYFYDLNVHLTHTFSRNDKVFLIFYKGKDNIQNKNENTETDGLTGKFTEKSNETSGWGNLIGSLRWNHTFGNNLFANTTFAYSSYDFFINNKYISTFNDLSLDSILEKSYNADYSSDISDLIVKTDFDYSISNNHRLLFGVGNTFHTFNPGENNYRIINPELNIKIDTSYTNTTIYASEPFFYVEDEIKATQELKINAGLRLSGSISDSKMSFNAEPRLSVNYAIHPQLVVKAGYSRMVQYLHLLSTSGVTMPTDIWVPALKGLQPLKSDQINVGISYIWNKKVLFSVEAYRKWLINTTDFKNGTSLLTDLSPWYEKTTQGHGDAKGIEISVEKQQGDLTGSFNYTLSTATRNYADLNNGQTFPFRYDRLHDFNISVNYKFSKKWDISSIWLFGTGYPVTVPVEKYLSLLHTGNWLIYSYPSLNNYSLPAYHRLDIGFHYKTINRLGENTLSFDIFNVYNRKNPVNIYYLLGYSFDYVYLLHIIPSVTYTLKFI